jgi:hypothetical protein
MIILLNVKYIKYRRCVARPWVPYQGLTWWASAQCNEALAEATELREGLKKYINTISGIFHGLQRTLFCQNVHADFWCHK